MDKEKLNDIICQSSSDYEILNNAYNYIENLEKQCEKQKEVIDKAIEYINHFSKESEVKIYGLPKCKIFIGDIEELLEILEEGKNVS